LIEGSSSESKKDHSGMWLRSSEDRCTEIALVRKQNATLSNGDRQNIIVSSRGRVLNCDGFADVTLIDQ